MGKKGSWLSAIKRVFNNSKEKATEKKSLKEKKKWGLGKLRNEDNTNSFVPVYSNRGASSIEKILVEAEKERQKARPLPSNAPEKKANSSYVEKAARKKTNWSSVEEAKSSSVISANYHHISAVKIQTAYRGHYARRSFRALKGLVRLQGVVRGQSVKHQTMNAMRCMQLMVRVQTKIQSRRIQMVENQALHRQYLHRSEKEQESTFGRWTLAQPSENGQHEEWDDSLLTREELDARMQRKVEAVMKRERALSYAYAHKLWKDTSKSAHAALKEIQSGGFPWWWNWLERQLPAQASETQTALAKDNTPFQPESHRRLKSGLEIADAATYKSLGSSPATKPRQPTTPLPVKASPREGVSPFKHVKPRTDFSLAAPLRDDDSLTSCPPFSAPNYMAPTASAKAKARAHSIPKERSAAAAAAEAAPSRDRKKRFSFPLTHSSFGSSRWTKGSVFSNKDSSSQRMAVHGRNLSVDSTLSLPAGVGRKPFR